VLGIPLAEAVRSVFVLDERHVLNWRDGCWVIGPDEYTPRENSKDRDETQHLHPKTAALLPEELLSGWLDRPAEEPAITHPNIRGADYFHW